MSNKFKFKLKITGFEMEVEGSKEDVASITSNVSSQLKNLVQPKGITDDDIEIEDGIATVIPQPIALPVKKKSRAKRNNTSSAPGSKKEVGGAIDFVVDIQKYGSPKMAWSTLQKSLWMMYVIKETLSNDELTLAQITETFNKHFKQAKTIRHSNVSRDLGSSKVKSPSLVGENTTVSPATWYLTEEGIRTVQNLLMEK